MRIAVMEGPNDLRRSLEQSLHDLATQGPEKQEQFCQVFANALQSVEQAISEEIAQHEQYASSLLRSIELTISVPEHQSPQQEADFRKAAQAQVHNSKLLSANAKRFGQMLLDVSRLADTKISTDITFE
ncbi:unnamed protein product, partial [Cylindrotheca closterium]